VDCVRVDRPLFAERLLARQCFLKGANRCRIEEPEKQLSQLKGERHPEVEGKAGAQQQSLFHGVPTVSEAFIRDMLPKDLRG
jgi:hypothetical protein